MSDSNRYSCSQSKRVTVTLHPLYCLKPIKIGVSRLGFNRILISNCIPKYKIPIIICKIFNADNKFLKEIWPRNFIFHRYSPIQGFSHFRRFPCLVLTVSSNAIQGTDPEPFCSMPVVYWYRKTSWGLYFYLRCSNPRRVSRNIAFLLLARI